MSRYVGAFVLIVFYSSQALYAQNALSPYKTLDQYNYDHWSSEAGLPVNSIIDIIQSRSGYIWFVSYGGITRFNGNEFFTYSSFNVPVIVNNSYTHIYEDQSGVIWASSSGGGVTAIDGDEVRVYTTADGLPSNFVEQVVQDSYGRLWVATSNGLCYKDGKGFQNHDTPQELKRTKVQSVTVGDGYLWAATVDKGVYKYTDRLVTAHYDQDNGLPSNNVHFVQYSDGELSIGTDSGLVIIKNDDEIKHITEADGLPGNRITFSLKDNGNVLWIGSYKGMCRINGDEFSSFSNAHPLYGQDITSIMQDDEGNLWVGTYLKGLFKLWDGKFTNYSRFRPDESSSFVVHSVCEVDDNTILIVWQQGVNILNRAENTISDFKLITDISNTRLKSGTIDSQGALWLSSLDNLVRYKDGTTQVYTTANGLVHDNVRVVFEDSKKNIWVGTTKGISVISAKGIVNYSVENGLSHEYIMSFEEDADGNIWIGTRNGLNLYSNGIFNSYYAKDGLAGDFVFKTYREEDGTIWICGNAGLTRYRDGKFSKITTKEGLSSNTIFQILEDDLGYFWITTNQKNVTTFKVLKQELHDVADGKLSKVNSIFYSQKDGLKSTAAISSAESLKSSDGLLWFATDNGVEMIDPANIKLNQEKPKVVMEEFILNDKVLKLDTNLIIPSGKQRITIKFAALSYIATEGINYKYKLVGYDNDWIDSKGKRETSYTNLPYDNYSFKVIAANSDDIWNHQGATISFYLKPKFYETKTFIMALVLLGLGLAGLVYQIRVKSLKNAQRELARIVAERTSEVVHQKEEIEAQKESIEGQQEQIELKNKELHKINLHLEDIVEERTKQLERAYKELLLVNKELDTFIYRSVHDVRGPIARLQGLSHLISLETTDDQILKLVNLLNETADEMNDVFYRLLNIVRLKASELNIHEVDIKGIIDQVLLRLLPEPQENLEVKINIDPAFKLLSDKDTVEIILDQLLDNAIKFRSFEGTHVIEICCTCPTAGVVAITVQDNGIGIPKEIADKVFEMFFVGQDTIPGAGLGLYTVRTAVKVLRGKVSLANNKKGTTFQVILPANL